MAVTKEESNSLFTHAELYNNSPSGILKLSTNFIRSSSNVKKRKINKKGGTVYISEATASDKKIEDTCTEIYQANELKKGIDYKILHNKAMDNLSDKFIEFGLITSDDNSKQRNKEIELIKSVAIDNFIKNEVSKIIPPQIKMPIKDFIKRTGIPRIQNRFNEALKMISESSPKLVHSWLCQTVEFKEVDGVKKAVIVNDLTQGSIIPKFKLRFNDKIKEYFDDEQIRQISSIEKFIELDIKNKLNLVDDIILIPDGETVVEIVGVGLFGSLYGKGYARTLRKNRNAFKKSHTFNFDLLIRTIINIPSNTSLTQFTFEELKVIIGTDNYSEWDAFKKNLLIPIIREQEENTEIKCDYELVPSYKSWTHIKLKPSWKNKSLGFEAIKDGYDYLAYFLAVQHRYFQKNNLDSTLENFIPYVQSEIYSCKDDEVIYEKTLGEWKDYTRKVYQIEQELLTFIDNNIVLLDENNIFYDPRLMCLLKKSKTKNEELVLFNNALIVEPKNKNTFIRTPVYKVIDPISSLRYLNELLVYNKEKSEYYIYDFMPFHFASFDSTWKHIDSLEEYSKNKDAIRASVFKKKVSFFRFKDEEVDKKELFVLCVYEQRFKEIDKQFKELMISLS